MRTIRIGVAGLGTVGAEAVRLLKQRQREFDSKLQSSIRVVAVCDRRAAVEARRLGLPKSIQRTRNYRDLLKNPNIDIIVETMGGLDHARELVVGALRSGKHVVTANKRLLSHHWDEIIQASQSTGRRVRFEASVAGGIPILHALHQSLAANRIRRVLGILNGTTNFILTHMTQGGSDFKTALAHAQRLGLAERDPTMDIDGTDAAHKVSVIASLLTGQWVRSKLVAHTGIVDIRREDIRFAGTELGCAIKLLGVVELDWSSHPIPVTAFVCPTLVPASHPLAAVNGEYNAVIVETSAAGDLMFYGKGAGAGPAASAVVGDVFMLSQDILTGLADTASDPIWARGSPIRVRPVQETCSAYYLRLTVADRPGVLSKIAGALGKEGISIAQIHQDLGETLRRPEASVFITTHPVAHRKMEQAVRSVLKLPFVSRRHAWLRMLS